MSISPPVLFLGYLGFKEETLELDKTKAFCKVLWPVPDHLPDQYSYRVNRGIFSYFSVEGDGLKNKREEIFQWVFRQSTLHLYRYLSLENREIKVILGGVVTKDGVGDFYHMTFSATLIQRAFSKANVTLCPEVENFEKRKSHFEKTHFCTLPVKLKNLNFVERIYENSDEVNKCRSLVSRADVALDLPHLVFTSTLIPYRNDLCNRITEFGSNGCYRVDFVSQNAMGIGPYECGLLWDIPDVNWALTSFESETLKQFFFQDVPLEAWSERAAYYHSHHMLHYAYMHEDENFLFFIKLTVFLDYDKSLETIDIFTSKNIESEIDPHDLIGIKEIQRYDLFEGKIRQKIQKVAYKGKILRLINFFPLASNDDIYRLIMNANGPVGCTGDNSFAKVVFSGRIPYYEVVLHKGSFVDSLIEQAQELFGPKSAIAAYMEASSFRRFKDVEKCWNDPKLFKEWEEFVKHLKKHHNFGKVLVDIIQRLAVLKLFPDLLKKEKALLKEYLDGNKSLMECHKELEERIICCSNDPGL